MLMAAGLGTRLRPFTDLEPKALIPVMGIPVSQFAVDALGAAGVRNVVANVHHLADVARAGLSRLEYAPGTKLTLSDESQLLLGSAGGMRKASLALGDAPFFLLNADVICDLDLSALARAHSRLAGRHGVKLTLAVFARGPEGGRYREVKVDAEAGLVAGLGELAQGRPFFVGAAVIDPVVLRGLPLDRPSEFVPAILEPAIAEGKAGAFMTEGRWMDVGEPKLWLDAHLELIGGLETGRLPQAWRRRLESANHRIGEGVWVSRQARFRAWAPQWAAPCYWDPWRDTTARAPRELGPRAVVYGPEPGEAARDGVAFRSLWASQTGPFEWQRAERQARRPDVSN